MRRVLLVLALAVATAFVIWVGLRRKTTPSERSGGLEAPRFSATGASSSLGASNRLVARDLQPESFPTLDSRRSMSSKERMQWLERLGRIPDDADNTDWQIAQKTSWWGKRIDPGEFWKGRVVWWDKSAEKAAEERGRRFPPLPYEDPAFSRHSDRDIVLASGGVEVPSINFRATDRERAFWDSFTRKNPKPPEMLKDKVLEAASHLGCW